MIALQQGHISELQEKCDAYARSGAELTFLPEVPEGAEDLTVIASVDEDVQRLLYIAGVRTLEEIAQWGRGEARRISTQVNVSEDTIMNQWVFDGFDATYTRLGVFFDEVYYESQTYLLGKDIVEQGKKDGIFEEVEGGGVGR